MEPDVTWHKVDRYLAGEFSSEEARQVEQELEIGETARETLKGLDMLSVGASVPPMARMWKAAAQRSAPRPVATGPVAPRPVASRPIQRTKQVWIGIAAAVAVVIGISQFGNVRNMVTGKSLGLHEISTTSNEISRFTLPDNSTVTLAPNSTVRYTRGFGSSSDRSIQLEGQALFTVTHQSGAPFTVQTGDVATRVLGTSFTVRRYEVDTAVQVVVAQGKVSVGHVVLSTGDVALAATEARVAVTRGNDIATALSWVDGQLVFAEVPLQSVIPEIERWYGVTVSVADSSLLSRPVSVTIGSDPLARAMELVAFNVGAKVEQDGTQIVLRVR